MGISTCPMDGPPIETGYRDGLFVLNEVCDMLGIDHQGIQSIDIHIECDRVPTIDIHGILENQEIVSIVNALKKRREDGLTRIEVRVMRDGDPKHDENFSKSVGDIETALKDYSH